MLKIHIDAQRVYKWVDRCNWKPYKQSYIDHSGHNCMFWGNLLACSVNIFFGVDINCRLLGYANRFVLGVIPPVIIYAQQLTKCE